MDNIISVIEVGSSSVRSLACKVNGSNIELIKTDFEFNDINTECNKAEAVEIFTLLNNIIDRFKTNHEYYSPNKSIVFGTQALRELSSKFNKEYLSILNYVILLSEEEEALCSYHASIDRIKGENNELTVIDIGSSSIEIIHGRVDSQENIESISIPMGMGKIWDFLTTNKLDDIQAYKHIYNYFEKYSLEKYSSDNVFLLGSVFTNLSWVVLNLSGNDEGRYSPVKVDNYEWETNIITQFTNSILSNSDYMQMFHKVIAKAYPNRKREQTRLTYGMFVTSILLKKLEVNKAYLNIQGTRHGVARLINNGYNFHNQHE